MTKKVRIENADSAGFKVVVQVFDKSSAEGVPDTLAKEINLNNPGDITDMFDPYLYITSHRYIVVKEAS